jgi:uncharacterized membrane protein
MYQKVKTTAASSEPVEKPTVSINRLKTSITSLLQDRYVVFTLFLFVLITRIPFQSQILYHWDSVNFASAVHHFDLANESPHPPGYILYVWLIRGVNVIFNNPQQAMVSISIVSSALAVVAMYWLSKSLFSRKTALAASLFLATSPIFWFYGEIALPHTLDMLIVILSVWLLYLTMQGDHRFMFPAVLSVAVAGGLRPQTLVFLLPLVLFSLRKVGIVRISQAAFFGAFVCVLWFVPLVAASGGLQQYFHVMGEFSDRFQESTSIFMGAGIAGVQYNSAKVVLYTVYGLSLAIIPAVVFGLGVFVGRSRKLQVEKALFLMIWIAPALCFYLIIHMGQQGLIFIYLPALLLIGAVGLVQLTQGRHKLISVGIGAVFAFNIALFTLIPEYPLGPNTQRMLTRHTLKNSDRYFQVRIDAIGDHFDPAKTVIIARDWRHAAYYLPGYVVIPLDRAKWDGYENLKFNGFLTVYDLETNIGGVDTIYAILFDDGLDSRDRSGGDRLNSIEMRNGEQLAYYEMDREAKLYIDLSPVELTMR